MFGLSVTMILSSCGSVESIFGNSPATATKKYYANCNDGQYSKVDELLSADVKKTFHEGRVAIEGGLQEVCRIETHEGTVTSVDIKDVVVKGEGATVYADIHFIDGSTKQNEPTNLIKENGGWKISF